MGKNCEIKWKLVMYSHSDILEPTSECPSLLVIAVDANPSQSILKKNPSTLSHILNSISAFGNAHLMQKPQNKLAVVATNHCTSKFLYPSTNKTSETRQFDGQHEYFTHLEKTIKKNLAELVRVSTQAQESSETMLAGCLAMALCYISRVSESVLIDQSIDFIVSIL